jgi:hypothetical protein
MKDMMKLRNWTIASEVEEEEGGAAAEGHGPESRRAEMFRGWRVVIRFAPMIWRSNSLQCLQTRLLMRCVDGLAAAMVVAMAAVVKIIRRRVVNLVMMTVVKGTEMGPGLGSVGSEEMGNSGEQKARGIRQMRELRSGNRTK